MSSPAARIANELRHELHVMQGNWVWYLVLGILLIVTGTIALGAVFLATVVTVEMISGLLIIGGIVQVLGSFWARRWSGFFALLLLGLLYLIIGVATLTRPLEFAAGLTLVIASFLLVGGVFRIVLSLMYLFPNWGWLCFHGLLMVALGVMILSKWPASGLWVIGMFVGIEMIFNGWTWVMLAIALRSGLPKVV